MRHSITSLPREHCPLPISEEIRSPIVMPQRERSCWDKGMHQQTAPSPATLIFPFDTKPILDSGQWMLEGDRTSLFSWVECLFSHRLSVSWSGGSSGHKSSTTGVVYYDVRGGVWRTFSCVQLLSFLKWTYVLFAGLLVANHWWLILMQRGSFCTVMVTSRNKKQTKTQRGLR